MGRTTNRPKGAESGIPAQSSRARRRRQETVQPEIWFRVVHVAGGANSDAPVSAYRDQTVEIALGPIGTFENGNVGALSRRVAAELVVNAVPVPRGKPKPPKNPRTPRVVELLQKAMEEWRTQIESGKVSTQAAIALREGITRSRVTQIFGLLRLAPEIRQQILALPDDAHQPTISERALRSIVQMDRSIEQLEAFGLLMMRASD